MKKQLRLYLTGLVIIIFATASFAQNNCGTDFTLNSPNDDISGQALAYQADNLAANISITGNADVVLQGLTSVVLTDGFSVEEGSVLLAVNDCAVNNSNITEVFTFSIYPNPATDMLNISVEEAAFSKFVINVVNSLGQRVIKDNTVNITNGYIQIQIDISNLPMGSYFVQFSNTNSIFNREFVKL